MVLKTVCSALQTLLTPPGPVSQPCCPAGPLEPAFTPSFGQGSGNVSSVYRSAQGQGQLSKGTTFLQQTPECPSYKNHFALPYNTSLLMNSHWSSTPPHCLVSSSAALVSSACHCKVHTNTQCTCEEPLVFALSHPSLQELHPETSSGHQHCTLTAVSVFAGSAGGH